MELRRLGKTELHVSELALGTMQFGWTASEDDAFAILDAYVEAGGNCIDTADIYSNWAEGNPGGVSEEIIGRWMRARGNRGQVVLATKVRGRMWDGPDGEGLGRAHIRRAAEESLRRLQTDHIDLYQTHWFDANTPIDETVSTLDGLVQSGKVRYIGCSNTPAWRLVEALWASDKHGLASYVSLQPHYNLVHREEFERDFADVVRTYGLGVLPYSPLAGGFLTGKYKSGRKLPQSARAARIRKRYFNASNFRLLAAMEDIAHERGRGVQEIALAWLLADPLITAPIIGANSVAQLRATASAASLRLSKTEIETLTSLSDWRET